VGEGISRELLIVGEMLVQRLRREIGIALAELVDEELVGLTPSVVLMGVGVQQPETDPDIALTSPPEEVEDPFVPRGHRRCDEGEVERSVVVVDVIHAAVGITQLRGDAVELVESLVREPAHGATGEVGFEQAAAA
jgi:hypothetical protein